MDPHFDGVIFQTHAAELRRRLSRPFPPFLVLDLRSRADFESGHLPGAVSTSPEAVARSLPEGTGEHTELIVVGAGPGDPAVREASRALMGHGAHRVVELPGGMLEWRQAGYSVEGAGAAQAA